jgi:hypothetical protein
MDRAKADGRPIDKLSLKIIKDILNDRFWQTDSGRKHWHRYRVTQDPISEYRLNIDTDIGYHPISSGTLRYYDIIVFLWYHSLDYDIIVNIIPMIS